MFEIAAPLIGEIVNGRKRTQNIAKDVGTKSFQKQLNWEVKKIELLELDPFLYKVALKTVALAKTFLSI